MLADGTELGFGPLNLSNRLTCGPKPAGQGAVFRYFRNKSDDESGGHGWPSGEVGYLKGIGMGTDGKDRRKFLSLSNGAPPVVAWYDSNDSYGFMGWQMSGGRIALYARDLSGTLAGLRGETVPLAKDAVAFYGQQSQFPVCLDCSFVPLPVSNTNVGPYF